MVAFEDVDDDLEAEVTQCWPSYLILDVLSDCEIITIEEIVSIGWLLPPAYKQL